MFGAGLVRVERDGQTLALRKTAVAARSKWTLANEKIQNITADPQRGHVAASWLMIGGTLLQGKNRDS